MRVLLETHFPGSKSYEHVRTQAEIMPVGVASRPTKKGKTLLDNIFTVKRIKSPGLYAFFQAVPQRAVDKL